MVAIVGGNAQTGVIGSTLPEPLSVELRDEVGAPVAGKPVIFKVRGNDGTLGGARQAAVVTGSDGRAQVSFTLGTRAGVGNQVVEAFAVGLAGPAMFMASALAGDPNLIVVDAGSQQVGVAGRVLPRPLVAAVTDAGYNRLPSVPVRLQVAQGHGHFDNGLEEITVLTDGDGRVIVPFTLDPEEGVANNVVEATIDGLADSSKASFVATGWTAGPPEETAIHGVVLDNTNQPIPGVTLRVRDTALAVQTDAQGLFRIPNVPVGTVYLIADGSTADRPGAWPELESVVTTVPGRDNDVGMPIFLLPLDLGAGLYVDETHGGTLTMPDVPGFALEIAPGSVTFAGGARSGVVSVTPVYNDKVPMVPNFGQQPRFIVTVQPPGARFDPPARLTLPNVEGIAPGAVTELYSFDHDLGHFVSIGPATVSEDGTLIVSDPGVGILKSGWQCGGSPAASGTAHHCPTCKKCFGGTCVADDTAACDDGNMCTVNDHCTGGSCMGDPKRIVSVQAFANFTPDTVAELAKTVFFTAEVVDEHCPEAERHYFWDFGDGAISTQPAPSHAYTFPGKYTASVRVSCGSCPGTSQMGTATVKVIFVKVQFADVTQDRINIFLAPPEVSGTLTVELTGSATDQILSEMRDGGDQTIPFDIPALMDGEYTKVKATWEVDSRPVDDELAYHIIVLGQWRQSQYNVPTESGCTGSATDVFMLPNIGRCFTGITGTNATLRSDFAGQTALNGTGTSDAYGTIKALAASSCFKVPPSTWPPGADTDNTFVEVGSVTGKCLSVLDSSSLAACAGDSRLPCGARIFIHTVGIKTVQDACPACCGGGQLDNFTTVAYCRTGIIPDLGTFMTIRIFN